jgi:hypothetical protein
MYLILTTTYPNDKVKQVSDMYVKVMTKYPPDPSLGTPVVPVAIRATPQGIEALVVHDVKKGKLDDAMTLAANRLAMFHDIPGYRYRIDTYLNLEEALKTISA